MNSVEEVCNSLEQVWKVVSMHEDFYDIYCSSILVYKKKSCNLFLNFDLLNLKGEHQSKTIFSTVNIYLNKSILAISVFLSPPKD